VFVLLFLKIFLSALQPLRPQGLKLTVEEKSFLVKIRGMRICLQKIKVFVFLYLCFDGFLALQAEKTSFVSVGLNTRSSSGEFSSPRVAAASRMFTS
jgi:hypothetical protein